MARTHFKGVVRKRLMPFRLLESGAGSGSGGCSVAPGARVLLGPEGGAAVGVVRVVAGDAGLAVLRLGKALPVVDAGRPLTVEAGEGGATVAVRAWRPDWWPQQWGHEEGQQVGGE